MPAVARAFRAMRHAGVRMEEGYERSLNNIQDTQGAAMSIACSTLMLLKVYPVAVVVLIVVIVLMLLWYCSSPHGERNSLRKPPDPENLGTMLHLDD